MHIEALQIVSRSLQQLALESAMSAAPQQHIEDHPVLLQDALEAAWKLVQPYKSPKPVGAAV